jgi:hypothetical protein
MSETVLELKEYFFGSVDDSVYNPYQQIQQFTLIKPDEPAFSGIVTYEFCRTK